MEVGEKHKSREPGQFYARTIHNRGITLPKMPHEKVHRDIYMVLITWIRHMILYWGKWLGGRYQNGVGIGRRPQSPSRSLISRFHPRPIPALQYAHIPIPSPTGKLYFFPVYISYFKYVRKGKWLKSHIFL